MYQKHCSFEKKPGLSIKYKQHFNENATLRPLVYFDLESQKTYIPSTLKNRALVSLTIHVHNYVLGLTYL